MPDNNIYDVIVIGGGSAGCVIAARLSEDSQRRVLLLEAGPDPLPVPDMISNVNNGNRVVLESDYVVMYPTERKIDGSIYYPLAGRIMGGGSSVNMGGVVRPTQHDLDHWGSLGNPGWSFEECLPILNRIETDVEFGHEPYHGDDGPLNVIRRFSFDDPRSGPPAAFIDRAVALGYPLLPDRNVPNPFGVAPSASNIKDGKRQSTAVAYLGPARDRDNLTIIDQAVVHSLRIVGSRVEEVVYERHGQMQSATADQVVLSAGVFHSPQILQLSGVGPSAELEKMGITQVMELPGVGGNYQDHAGVNLVFEGPEGFSPDWVVSGFQLMYKSDPAKPNSDFHIYMRAPVIVEGLTPMMPVAMNLIEARGRGRVHLASTNPHDLPIIDDGMLQDPDDIKAMLAAMHFVYDFVQDDSMREFFGELIQPGPEDAWADYARSTYDSYHHGIGTCKMGPASDPEAVVGADLRVHGLDNLYVADASIMPTVTHANTNITTIMIGERLADFVTAQG